MCVDVQMRESIKEMKYCYLVNGSDFCRYTSLGILCLLLGTNGAMRYLDLVHYCRQSHSSGSVVVQYNIDPSSTLLGIPPSPPPHFSIRNTPPPRLLTHSGNIQRGAPNWPHSVTAVCLADGPRNLLDICPYQPPCSQAELLRSLQLSEDREGKGL